MADITSLFSAGESRLMELTDPTTGERWKNDEGKVSGFLVTDTESEACKAVTAAYRKAHKKTSPSMDQEREFTVALLAAAVTGFVNVQMGEDMNVQYSPELARRYIENSPSIRKQVNEYAGADENFIKGVLKS